MSVRLYQITSTRFQVDVSSKSGRRREHVRGDINTVEIYRRRLEQMEALDGVDLVEYLREKKAKAKAARHAPKPIAFKTLREEISSWVDSREKVGDIRAGSAKVYRAHAATWTFPRIGAVRVNEVTVAMLGGVLDDARSAGRSRSTLRCIVSPIASYFERAVKEGRLTTNPAADLADYMPAKSKARPAVFSREQALKILEACKAIAPRWHALLVVAYGCGLRWGELVGLHREQVDFSRSTITVDRAFGEKSNRMEKPKNGKTRDVKMPAEVAAVLRAHLEAITLEGQVEGWSIAQRQLVFPNTHGKITHKTPFMLVWRRVVAAAGVPYRKFHAARHSYISWHLSAGSSPKWVQEQAGHYSMALTADVYGHCMPGDDASAERLNFLSARA
jgi:integrase